LLLRKGGQTVYFGDIGEGAESIISYFEHGGARKCKPGENPYVFIGHPLIHFDFRPRAEYMLDVIGAGATAVADRDWRQVWVDSKEYKNLEGEIDQLHAEGRSHPPVAATVTTRFATPWTYQARVLLKRQSLVHWRDPTYLMSKLSLNIIGGLFIGFTFFKSKDTIQGTQNKLFVCILIILPLSTPYPNL
jgi:ATP-binding cassette subfamily G (WHITE) protein 2 (SNQ2)